MNDPKAQLVEKLKSASNILVTVSTDPSVDQIAACIAMTLLLNKYKKNATAVFSGKVPFFLDYLKPNETIEKTTDSLRDFIIALDKSKADKLRYKVEDDVVKIFITPYRTSITKKDLNYSAGEFNVDLILALGVHHQQDLDMAITAHGRIFHDAVTMSINNTPHGDFGTVNWEDIEASSLSELIADLIELLDANLLDADIATALLTGIVAETGRFSNDKTHPRTMTVSSKLLEAGANQKLVNTQLQDLIGTVVNLEAGTEIVPTADTSAEPLHHDDAAAELMIDENGVFGQSADTTKNTTVQKANSDASAEKAAGKAAPAKNAEPEGPAATESAELVLPGVNPDNVSDNSGTPVDQPLLDSLLGEPVEATPAPALDEADNQPEASTIDADADAARQAIEDALVANPAPQEPVTPEPSAAAAPSGWVSAATPAPAAASPLIQGIANNQPSYASPLTTTQYDMPIVPEHEPAPLGMSPADQPFTMPMPPAGLMPSEQPAIAPAQAGNAPGTMMPPPLPPPMPPPSFS